MSYDVQLVDPPCPHCKRSGPTGERHNYTWNMGYAIREGGVDIYRNQDGNVDGLFHLEGSTAKDAIEPLRRCIAYIIENADELRKDEPDNGWGSVDRVVSQFLRPILNEAEEDDGNSVFECW